MIKIRFALLLICLMGVVTTSCKDELTSTYSEKYRVMCGFQVVSYKELINVIGNYGQFASIRQSGSQIVMKTLQSETSYNMDALSKDFRFGLGGYQVYGGNRLERDKGFLYRDMGRHQKYSLHGDERHPYGDLHGLECDKNGL